MIIKVSSKKHLFCVPLQTNFRRHNSKIVLEVFASIFEYHMQKTTDFPRDLHLQGE